VTAGLAGAALLLAFLFHLGVAAVATAILATVPGVYVAWKALPGPVKKPALGRPTSQWTPSELGVRPAIGGGPGDPMPTYVPRRHDEVLRAVLDPAVAASRLVVVRGGSSTGKTRAAYRAVTDRRFADWRLDYPQTHGVLAARLDAGIPAGTVLWLGELREYADADGGPEVLGRLADLLDDKGHLLITTVWPEDWETYLAAARGGPGAADPRGVVGRLLERLPVLTEHDPIDPARGGVIDVPDKFTTTEMADLADTGDPVLAEAAAAAARAKQDGQITQYLAGVPELLNRYNGPSGYPYGQAIITAAMDAARLGHASPLPVALLQDAAVGYLTDPQRTASIESWWDKALDWAKHELRGAVRAMQPVPPPAGTGEDGYQVADYLDQYGRRTRQDLLGPTSLWDALAAHAFGASDLARLAQAASDRGMWRRAAALWTTAAGLGHTGAAARLIRLLRQVSPGDTTRVAGWAAVHARLGDTWAVVALLGELRESGADDAVHTVATWGTGDARLDDPRTVAVLLGALRESGADDAARDLLARDPVAHARLDDPDAIAMLLRVLRAAEADDAARALATRAASDARLDDPGAIARLLGELRAAEADDAARALATRAASDARLDDPGAIARLLGELRAAQADDAARALATRAASDARLDDPGAIAELLRALRAAQADDALHTLLARDPAAHILLFGNYPIRELLKELRKTSAGDAAVHTLMARVTDARLDDPQTAAAPLWVLQEAGADDRVLTSLARDLAADARVNYPQTVEGLLHVLRKAGAGDAARALAIRAASDARLDDPNDTAMLFQAVRNTTGISDDAVRSLAARAADHVRLDDPRSVAFLLLVLRNTGISDDAVRSLAARAANHVRLYEPHGIAMLLQELHAAGADKAVSALTGRTAHEGRFDVFLKANPEEVSGYRFGREPDGAPSPPWNWQEPISHNRGQ
jgi:hypothetical protein